MPFSGLKILASLLPYPDRPPSKSDLMLVKRTRPLKEIEQIGLKGFAFFVTNNTKQLFHLYWCYSSSVCKVAGPMQTKTLMIHLLLLSDFDRLIINFWKLDIQMSCMYYVSNKNLVSEISFAINTNNCFLRMTSVSRANGLMRLSSSNCEMGLGDYSIIWRLSSDTFRKSSSSYDLW